MSLLRLERVTKAYCAGRKKEYARIVLDAVDLSVEEGEFLALLGPSGCGKTVTLHMLAGFERPTLGRALFKGKGIEEPSPERGVVFQGFSLLPWLTPAKEINLLLKSQGMPKGKRQAIIEDSLKAVGMENFAHQQSNLLSGGMQQRVAIARLLAMDSEVFLMDEPFSALDEQTRNMLDESLVELWKEKHKTIVFVTHSISEAIKVATRIVLYTDAPGKIVKEWQFSPEQKQTMTLCERGKLHNEILELMMPEGKRKR